MAPKLHNTIPPLCIDRTCVPYHSGRSYSDIPVDFDLQLAQSMGELNGLVDAILRPLKYLQCVLVL